MTKANEGLIKFYSIPCTYTATIDPCDYNPADDGLPVRDNATAYLAMVYTDKSGVLYAVTDDGNSIMLVGFGSDVGPTHRQMVFVSKRSDNSIRVYCSNIANMSIEIIGDVL